MLPPRMLRVVCVVALTLATAVSAQQASLGTAAEAQAMLARVVAAVKTDTAQALAMCNKGEDGCKDRDLQPLCCNGSDGTVTAATVPHVLGTAMRTLKDKTSKACGQALSHTAREGNITEVSDLLPRPGTDPPLSHKVSVLTGVGDQGGGVGSCTEAVSHGPQRGTLVDGAPCGFRRPDRGSKRRWSATCAVKETWRLEEDAVCPQADGVSSFSLSVTEAWT